MKRLLACAAVVLLCAAPAWSDDLTTITGKGNLSGALEKITADDIVFKSGKAPVSQVLDVKLRDVGKPAAAYNEVHLTDDSMLRCSKVTLGAKDAQLVLTTGAQVKVPMSAILSVLRDAQDEKTRAQFEKFKRSNTKRADRIYRAGAGGLNPIPGSLGIVDEAKQSIKFTPEGLPEIDLPLDKVVALQFAPVEVPAAKALCKVIDVDGNILVASKLTYDDAKATVTTPFGQQVALDGKVCAKFDFNFGRLTFLSDLDAKVTDSVLLGGFSPVRKDANLDGNPIMIKDKKYDKGLSMYAGAEVEYALSGKYKKLTAILGVDPRIADEGQGKVTLKIYCDNEMRYSKEVSTDGPIPVNLNIQDVFQLRIVVVGSNFTNYSGHATLANAQVSQ